MKEDEPISVKNIAKTEAPQPLSAEQVSLLELVRHLISERYRRLSPERQYVFSAIALWMYLSIWLQPENLPDGVQPMISTLNQMPTAKLSWLMGSLISFAGTADGARRIVIDQLPFYKAYINAFVLRKRFVD